jgi:Fur family ferric uptake transcriptional regulator
MSHSQSIIEGIRKRGYRITPQRELIIQAIAQSDHHISAEEIAAELKKHTQAINIATIYRTLDMLWEEGFACRNDLGEGRIVYATLKHGPHIHLVCRKCNQVIDADPQVLDALGQQLRSQYDFKPDLEHLSIFGVCSDCQTE